MGVKLKLNKSTKSINFITIINLLGTFLLQGVAFFTIPIFTRMLGASNYGLFSTFESWVKIITCIMSFGVFSALAPGKFKFRESYKEFSSSVLLLGTILSGLLVAIGIIFRNNLARYTNLNQTIIILIFIAGFGHSIVCYLQTLLVYEKRAVENLILSVSISISVVMISLIAINRLPNEINYIGRIIGTVIPYVIVGLISSSILFFKRPYGLKKEYCSYSLCVGFPTVFHALSQNILSQSDRVMMQGMGITTEVIGIYSLYYSLSSVLGIILNALNTSWCPFYYEYIRNDNWKEINIKTKRYTELFSVIICGFILLSREVSFLMASQEYWYGVNIVPALAIAVFFTFLYQFPVNYEFYYGKTYFIAIGTVLSGGFNVLLNWFLIPKYGMYGATFATVCSYIVLFILHNFIVFAMKNASYKLKLSIFIPGLLLVIVGTLLFYILEDYWILRWMIGIALGVTEIMRIVKRKSIF